MVSLQEVNSSKISNSKKITESFLKKYSTKELSVLAKIPRLYRNKRACRYMQDIIHINPDKISKSNLNYLIKHQLLEGIIGLSAEEKLKKGDKLLTREEKKLYDVILKTQWTLKHITFDYDVIKENGNTLKSLQQRMRENNSLDNSHALQGTGKDDNVFFTLGSPQHKGAGFLHGKGGHVISLDINHFSEGGRLKEPLSGLQLSDHWFQYLNQGYFSQTYGNTKREIKFFDDTGESFTLKGHKIYSYYRHDGSILTRTVSLGQELVTGAEFFPFIAYNLILELRYIGGQYRQHLFNHLEQREIVEAAIDSFYHSSNFEATIPSQMSLNYPHITVTPQDTNSANTVDSALLMHEAISERQIDKIKNLLAVGVSIDILDDKGVTPLIKALSTYRYDIAYFLIDNGANLGLTYQKYSALAISILVGRMDIIEKILSKQIIVDDRDNTIFRKVDINRDITAISAGISRGYLSYFLSFELNIEKFSPCIMFLLTESILSEKMVIHSIDLLLQRGFKFNYGRDKKSDHYFSLTLLNAIHQQKLTLVKNLIKWGCKLNATPLYSDHQWVDITPLMLAVTSGNMEIVEMLVKSGADINKYDENGRTALMLAEKMKYQDIIEFLKYQSHEPKNDFVAAHKKEIAKALIYSKNSKSGKIYFLVGQKRNKKNYELFSLDSSKEAWKSKSLEDLAIKAVYSGALIDLLPHIENRNVQKKLFDRHSFRKSNTDLVIETHEYLVDDHHKLKPYPSDKYQNVRWISASNISNRHYLMSNYDYPMIESLIKNQPFNGHTYLYRLFKLNEQLFVAIEKNSCRAVEKLLVAGADANSLSDKNLTPLAIACDTPHPNLMLIQILIQHGSLLNYTCCYETTACNIPHPNLTLIQTLIQHDALLKDVCFYEMRELVPLQLAILQKSKSLISLLCENGANPNQKLGTTSMTPLLTACGVGNIKLIEELISYGADFKIDENKGIFARLCAIPCTDDLFDYLLDHADINGLSSTQFQYTPLMVCAKLGDINRIKKLLTKGANPSMRHPRTCKSASDLAFEQKNWNVVDILRESDDISQKDIGKLTDIETYYNITKQNDIVSREVLLRDEFYLVSLENQELTHTKLFLYQLAEEVAPESFKLSYEIVITTHNNSLMQTLPVFNKPLIAIHKYFLAGIYQNSQYSIEALKFALASELEYIKNHPENLFINPNAFEQHAIDQIALKKCQSIPAALDYLDKHSPIKKGITEFPAELAEYTDNGDYTERQKSKTKIFVNRSLLQTNIFNKIADFEGAFKEFYDKNINYLRLFRERESSKIFNLDNEAVHILLDKFTDIAQSGTKEEKKLVKSFFLNRDDHRDLSHLQQWSNSPPILPYHSPYIKFVMEQRYHGKEFKLFSLGEISKFYRSSDVSFYHEVPVQTWLKLVQTELPFSDFSIDTLVAAIPLLDNLCGDKSVLEKIFKQYMGTFDQLSVLSQEAATLIRLVLVFFNSSGSNSLKKSLLNKLNWNQISEMNIDCRIAVEDMIFLYRMHNVTLKFPSVEKQKLLGNLLLEKIKNISFVNEKITLLEQLIFTKSGYFNSPLADSVFRNEVIALWAEMILIKYGLDNASYVYYHTMKEVIDRINNEVSVHDKCYLFQQLANSIEPQSGLSTYMGEIISPRETKDSIQEKNVLGNALKMISKTEADKIKTLDFLSSPLTAKSLDIAVEHAMTIHDRDGIKELVQALCSCEDDYPRQYNKNDVKNALMMTYHQFWDLDLEECAGLINYLLIPTAKVLSLKDKREIYNQAFHYAVHKLFPNAQSDEQENFSKAFLIAYLQTANEYKREYLLAGIIFTLNEADSGSKVSSPGRKLVLLCKHLGPAYAKLVQTIHSHPITSENIRLDLDHIKGHANLPYRWDLWRLMDEVLPPPEKENTARVGSLLGCSNFYNLAIECKLKNRDEQVILLLLRDNATKDADGNLPLRKIVNACEHVVLQPHKKERVLDVIAEEEEMPTIETNKDRVNKQHKVENTSYQIEFVTTTTLSSGEGYRFLDRMWGSEFNDLQSTTSQDKIVHKAILGLFDFGKIPLKKPGKIELQQFANFLHSLARASRVGIESLDSAIKPVKQADEPSTYLMRIREAFLVMQTFQKELIDSDLIELLKSIHTYDVHPLLRAEITYLINKTSLSQYQPITHNRNFSPLDHLKNFTPFGVFATRRSIIAKPYNNTKSHQKNTLQNKQIFVTTAPRILAFAQGGTGDIDYANTVVNSLKEQYQDKITFIPACRDETSLYQQIRLNTPKGKQPILHVIVNAPDIGFMWTPEKLQTFKDKGGYVVVTVMEFAKHSGHQNFNLKSDTITFLEKADYAIFLDDNDQKSAIEFAEKIRKKIPPSRVIATFVNVPLANKALPERGKDIISFGGIRTGKGLAHVRKLAKLMKESDNLSIQGKKILVVGTVSQGQEDKWDRTLYDLMLGVYPEQAKAMDVKKPYELVALLKEIQSNPGIKPALPIEIHLNVTENELSKLFDCCTYSYLPGYRGATLRDSSISCSLTNQFVTYVHEGKITPEYLKVGGLYQEAVSMIKYDPKKDFYSYSAETVLADIVKRERDPKLNIKTAQATLKLVNEQLSLLSVIASEHDEIYSKSISLKAMKDYPFYYLPDEGRLTIPRREIAYPLPKRYQGFNRLSQTLRHISSVVFRTIKTEFRCNPKEVQVAMIVDKLHISSNFHSDKLAPALIMAVTQDNIIEKRAKWDKKTNKFDREHRHLISLKQYLLNDPIFGTTVDKGIAEIKQGLGIPQHSNLSVDEITGQFIIQMKTLRSVLQRCTNGDSFGVIVHAPPKVDTVINALLKNGETATRHAERNIVQYLADHAECIYNKSLDCFSLGVGKHVLVPMEGRFVPCGFCYEQEAVEKMPGKGGLFDPIQKRFLLHRSGYRAGKFFAREIQFFTFSSFHSNPAEVRVRSVQILDNIASSSPQLSIYSRPIVMNTFFNTDSEDSNEDDQISRNTHEKFQSPYKRESCLKGGK